MAESNLRKRGEHVWTGASGDAPNGKVLVDVRDLPESPPSYEDIPLGAVAAKVRRIAAAVERGDDVLVRCAHGVSRSPTIAKLYLTGAGKSFSSAEYFPNDAWKAFARVHAAYFKERRWS